MKADISEGTTGRRIRRRRWVVPVGAFLAAVFLFLILRAVRVREPVHGGKPLSYWLEQIEHDPKRATDAVRALQSVGTNAIPWLLVELETGSGWRYRANRLLDRQDVIRFRFSSVNERRERAMWGFFALGPEGKMAIPTLMGRIQAKILPSAELYALAFTGKEAIPFLIAVLTNEARIHAPAGAALAVATAVQLDRISIADAQAFVPALTQMLDSTNARSRAKAATALEHIRNKSDPGSVNR